MSKADYLKKYLSSDLNNEKKKKKLKLSSSYSSSSSRNERERKEGKEGRGVIIIDEDIINDTPSAENIEEAWERQGQEDQPVTVELEDNNENISRGKWVSIPLNVPKRKKDQDNSPPRRRNQDNNSPPRRNKTEDNSPPRKNKNNQDNSPPRRNKTNEDNSPPRRNRNNQDSPPRRNRNNEDNSPPRKNKIKNNEDNSPPRRKEEENIRENKEEFDSKGRRTKTSSGHNAGLQSIESFGEKERELQKKRERELKELGNIEQEETVYRDKRGRKLDMLNEFMRQQATTEGKKAKIEQAQYEWGRGIVQKESILEKQKELELVAAEPFARTIDDPRLEEMKKQTIRDGDPMAEYIASKRTKQQSQQTSSSSSSSTSQQTNSKRSKPLYRGPSAPPNRFNILPGYRWDAIDRGNGFENLLLKKLSSRQSFKDDEYKWSVSDM